MPSWINLFSLLTDLSLFLEWGSNPSQLKAFTSFFAYSGLYEISEVCLFPPGSIFNGEAWWAIILLKGFRFYIKCDRHLFLNGIIQVFLRSNNPNFSAGAPAAEIFGSIIEILGVIENFYLGKLKWLIFDGISFLIWTLQSYLAF